jgi:hypothetical protein
MRCSTSRAISNCWGIPKLERLGGFAIEQVLAIAQPNQAYFWATHQGAELDLMIVQKGKRYGFEMKLSDAPTTSKSMHVAHSDLGLTKLFVV